mgnify:CR=1 FL=1
MAVGYFAKRPQSGFFRAAPSLRLHDVEEEVECRQVFGELGYDVLIPFDGDRSGLRVGVAVENGEHAQARHRERCVASAACVSRSYSTTPERTVSR